MQRFNTLIDKFYVWQLSQSIIHLFFDIPIVSVKSLRLTDFSFLLYRE